MKKIIAILLVVMLVMPNIVFAENGEAVENGTVTRAEFARIVCMLIGLSGDMQSTFDPDNIGWWQNRFDDVPIEHWAAPFIDMLFSSMVIRGDGEGNFRPNDVILVEEAIAILARMVRAYYLRSFHLTIFPYNYIEIAEEIGLTLDIEFTVGEYVTMDFVRRIINNALDAPMFVHTWGAGSFLADGQDDRPLQTLRTHAWNCNAVYFDGFDFMLGEEGVCFYDDACFLVIGGFRDPRNN